jgi:fucose permease
MFYSLGHKCPIEKFKILLLFILYNLRKQIIQIILDNLYEYLKSKNCPIFSVHICFWLQYHIGAEQ